MQPNTKTNNNNSSNLKSILFDRVKDSKEIKSSKKKEKKISFKD